MIYDIIHGYQPFSKELKPGWVEKNFEEIFLPTSIAMKKGVIKRNVQLQGWTIDEWQKTKIADSVIKNLKEAYNKKNITLGCSLYSHALAPTLSEELIYALIFLDIETQKKIGKPIFFFPPELAIDKKLLKVIFENFPKLIPIIPCLSVKSSKSEIVCVNYNGINFICMAANVYLKDTLMNGTVYQNISYLPKSLSLKIAQFSMRNPEFFKETIEKLDTGGEVILARDWENGESRDALLKKDDYKEISGFLGNKDDFKLIDELKPTKNINFEDIIASSWEPKATIENPFPYWIPNKMSNVIKGWLGLISIYEKAFTELTFGKNKRSFEIVKNKLKKKDFRDIIKETSPALISCIPWHFLSRPEWESDTGFAIQLLEKIVKPKLMKLNNIVYNKVENFKKLLLINEYSNMITRY